MSVTEKGFSASTRKATHLPTGLTFTDESSRSQIVNRDIALTKLENMLLEKALEQERKARIKAEESLEELQELPKEAKKTHGIYRI